MKKELFSIMEWDSSFYFINIVYCFLNFSDGTQAGIGEYMPVNVCKNELISPDPGIRIFPGTMVQSFICPR